MGLINRVSLIGCAARNVERDPVAYLCLTEPFNPTDASRAAATFYPEYCLIEARANFLEY